ncbi:hypothetical protein ACFX2A_038910 [Malus domestica]
MSENSVNNNGLVTLQGDVNQGYDGTTVMDYMWEDNMEICPSLESIWRSALVIESARLTNMKTRIKDLKVAVPCFKELAT